MIRSNHALFALALAGCNPFTVLEPKLPPLSEDLQKVAAGDVWSIPTDAVFPTDVAVLPDGSFGVVDGYQHRVLMFDADRSFGVEVPLTDVYGDPVRASLAADGASWWLTVPEVQGLLRVAPSGDVLQAFQIMGDDGMALAAPMAVVETGGKLVAGLEDGALVWVDPATGTASLRVTADADGAPLGAITDIALDPDGQLLVADAFGARIHRFGADGVPVSSFGHFGLWAGWLAKPKSVAPGPDGTTLVADSQLGAVSLFDRDGIFLGLVAQGAEPIPFEHPIALQALDGGRYLAVDTRTGVLWGFTIEVATVEAAREAAAALRYLRTPLADLDQDAQLANGELCFHCHDGTIEDTREVWDPKLGHHPIDVVPDGEVPEFFPLTNGRIVCTTCHSPHGVVSAEEASGTSGEEVIHLVRHAPESEDDLFTRVSRTDAALCVACHTEDAHEKVIEGLGLGVSAHPTGAKLTEALAKRKSGKGPSGLPEGIDGGCLTCHAVHAAEGEDLQRSAEDEVSCLGCHATKGRASENHPIHLPMADSARVAHAQLTLDAKGETTCRTCHDMVGGAPPALLATPATGGLLCTTCHEPTWLAGPHINVEGEAGVPCLGCHRVHGGPSQHHLLVTIEDASAGDPNGCLGCHGPGGSEHVKGVEPGRLGHPVVGSKQTCMDCHDAHQPDAVAACSTCHEAQQAEFDRGGHGTAACADCHPVHESPPAPAGSANLNAGSRRCLGCHAPGTPGTAKKVAAVDHPAPVFTPGGARWTPLAGLPLFDVYGKVVPEGQNGDLTCSSCHLTHGPHPDKPGDHLRRPGWEESCASCHGDQGLVLYRFFHDPAARSRMGVTP